MCAGIEGQRLLVRSLHTASKEKGAGVMSIECLETDISAIS
jgi:hypothetical protein